MISSFQESLRELIATADPPELGPGPRAGVRSVEQVNGSVDAVLSRAGAPAGRGDLIRALVLLWHDHFDPSHALSQTIESADGSYVHGLLHRREPDYANAKYWFRRVGPHPCFPVLAEQAGEILAGSELAETLAGGGKWDPFAFIDACEAGAGGSGGGVMLLRRVQAVEFGLLLDWFAR